MQYHRTLGLRWWKSRYVHGALDLEIGRTAFIVGAGQRRQSNVLENSNVAITVSTGRGGLRSTCDDNGIYSVCKTSRGYPGGRPKRIKRSGRRQSRQLFRRFLSCRPRVRGPGQTRRSKRFVRAIHESFAVSIVRVSNTRLKSARRTFRLDADSFVRVRG